MSCERRYTRDLLEKNQTKWTMKLKSMLMTITTDKNTLLQNAFVYFPEKKKL